MRFFFFFLRENLTAFLLTTSDRKYSYNFATTVISQDDHLTAGAWAACGLILRIIQLNVIDPSPGKWLVTIYLGHTIHVMVRAATIASVQFGGLDELSVSGITGGKKKQIRCTKQFLFQKQG